MRKLRLSPIQRDILWMLEEAGKENLLCIRETLHYAESELNAAVLDLKRLGFVIDDVEGSLPALSLTKAGLTAIRT